jgi:hypothetical protein
VIFRSFSLFMGLGCFVSTFAAEPPYTDYCEMLARDIEGKMHSFIAGNHMYYIGGKVNTEWKHRYHETLGFTHPIFRDGRARGYGIATGAGGTGHDKFGWEFWNQVRGAWGTVVVDGKRTKHPRPISMIWRPDRVMCIYKVRGVNIREEKFISLDDVLCSIITSDKPIEIELKGQSFFNDHQFPTFDGDNPGQQYGQTNTARGRFDRANNTIHITEGGTTLTKLAWKQPAVVGKMMYDGMSVVISSSDSLTDSQKIETDKAGRKVYTFRLSCSRDESVALPSPAAYRTVITYAMHDDYKEAVARTKGLLAGPAEAMDAKTAQLNDLLNRQIPYFRCSDQSVVNTYYYLWSLYFMYDMDTGKGWESYPHTQTAINNFMGLHLWDSWVYAAMASWVVDKQRYGMGNVLSWKHMVPFKDDTGALPDNFGIDWYSPDVRMNLVGSVELSWDIYRRSADRKFLNEVYNDLFRKLYWESGPQPSMGIESNGLDALILMAKELQQDGDVVHWQSFRERIDRGVKNMWGAYKSDFFAAKGAPWKDIWHLASMMNFRMPSEWVDRMCDAWVMNTESGFLGPVGLRTRPLTDPPNGVFAVSTISNWLAIEGMFRHHRDSDAVLCTLLHIRGMNRTLGFPVAPEAWSPDMRPWGSLYYNWDSCVTDLLIKRIAGIDYSVADATFTVSDHLPEEWSFVETYVPVTDHNKTGWVHTKVEQRKVGGGWRKRIEVKNCPLNIYIDSWHNGRRLKSQKSVPLPERGPRILGRINSRGEVQNNFPFPAGHSQFIFSNTPSATVSLKLGKRQEQQKTLAVVTPYKRLFLNPIEVSVENLRLGTPLHFTLDGSQPTTKSQIVAGPIRIEQSCGMKLRSFSREGTPHTVMAIPFTRAKIHKPIEVPGAKPGLDFTWFKGKWTAIPDMRSLKPSGEGITTEWDVSKKIAQKNEYAVTYQGFLKMPKDGLYEFHLLSDDGTRITIHNKTVIDLNVHCGRDPWRAQGSIALKAGLHPLKLEYYQDKDRSRLQLKYRTEDGTHKTVPSEWFVRRTK